MCNLSEGIERKGIRKGMKWGMRKGIRRGIRKGMQKGLEEGLEKGLQLGQIRGVISVYRDLHLPEQKILQNLKEKFHLTPEEARQYLNQYKTQRHNYSPKAE